MQDLLVTCALKADIVYYLSSIRFVDLFDKSDQVEVRGGTKNPEDQGLNKYIILIPKLASAAIIK